MSDRIYLSDAQRREKNWKEIYETRLKTKIGEINAEILYRKTQDLEKPYHQWRTTSDWDCWVLEWKKENYVEALEAEGSTVKNAIMHADGFSSPFRFICLLFIVLPHYLPLITDLRAAFVSLSIPSTLVPITAVMPKPIRMLLELCLMASHFSGLGPIVIHGVSVGNQE